MPIVVATSLNRVLNLSPCRPNIRASSGYRVRELSSSSESESAAECYGSGAEPVVARLACSPHT